MYEGMGLQGFGTSTMQQVQDLQKALTAGTQNPPTSGGNALRVESLEESLKVLTYTDRHLKLWPKIFKSPAYSTVEEYNQLEKYGNDDYGAFLREGELPVGNDSTYTRRTQLIKFMGTTREITHPATLVHPAHGDLIALENQNGILWLLRQVEKFLFSGNSDLAASGEGEQWDGLDKLIDTDSKLDLEGAPTQEGDYEEVTNLLAENFAFPTDCFLGFRPMSDLVKTLYPRHRVELPADPSGRIGQSVNSITTQAGLLAFQPNVFLTRPALSSASSRGPSSMLPDVPVLSVAAATGTAGQFDKSQGADDAKYAYRVSASNRFGESACTAGVLSGSLTGPNAALGQGFPVTVTNAASITNPPEFINIYRTLALPSSTAAAPSTDASYSLIEKVKVLTQAAGAVCVSSRADNNITMPFTEVAYVGELSPQVISFRQLAPLMKIDLAVLAPSY
jgi:hypothetical protein